MKKTDSLISTRADLADLAGLGVLVGLTALFVFGLVMPLMLRSHRAQAHADEAARQRQQANALSSQIRDAKAELNRVQAQLTASPLRIDPPSVLNERLSQLIVTGGEKQLTLSELKPGEPIATKRYTITPIRLVGSGSYPSIAGFLQQLHERMPDLAVTGFKLERGTGETGVGRCELDFRWIARPAGNIAPSTPLATAQ